MAFDTEVLFSTGSDEWETPWDLFHRLDEEFHFQWDVAATLVNRKVMDYYGPDHHLAEYRDALTIKWQASPCWMNPPYSKGLQAKFIQKANHERWQGIQTVALLPARTDTRAFHRYIYDAKVWQPRPGIEIRLLAGRLKFGGATNSAPFPSMIVVFNPIDL